jgi:hypothetical protein
MRRVLLLSAMAASLFASAGAALACTSGRVRFYFSHQQPAQVDGLTMLRISIDPREVREMGVIRARLLGGVLNLPNYGSVLIRLDEPAAGTNCIHLGPTDGPVFVVGRLGRGRSGELTLLATPTRTGRTAPPRPRHGPGYYDQYIVDPAYLTPAERRRREERHDRP